MDSMREAVFIVSPKMLNLGSLVPMRQLKVNVGEHVESMKQHEMFLHMDIPSHIPVHHHSYLSQGPVWMCHTFLSFPSPAPSYTWLTCLTQGPVWMPMRMTTGVPSCGMRTCGGQSG